MSALPANSAYRWTSLNILLIAILTLCDVSFSLEKY